MITNREIETYIFSIGTQALFSHVYFTIKSFLKIY